MGILRLVNYFKNNLTSTSLLPTILSAQTIKEGTFQRSHEEINIQNVIKSHQFPWRAGFENETKSNKFLLLLTLCGSSCTREETSQYSVKKIKRRTHIYTLGDYHRSLSWEDWNQRSRWKIGTGMESEWNGWKTWRRKECADFDFWLGVQMGWRLGKRRMQKRYSGNYFLAAVEKRGCGRCRVTYLELQTEGAEFSWARNSTYSLYLPLSPVKA